MGILIGTLLHIYEMEQRKACKSVKLTGLVMLFMSAKMTSAAPSFANFRGASGKNAQKTRKVLYKRARAAFMHSSCKIEAFCLQTLEQ